MKATPKQQKFLASLLDIELDSVPRVLAKWYDQTEEEFATFSIRQASTLIDNLKGDDGPALRKRILEKWVGTSSTSDTSTTDRKEAVTGLAIDSVLLQYLEKRKATIPTIAILKGIAMDDTSKNREIVRERLHALMAHGCVVRRGEKRFRWAFVSYEGKDAQGVRQSVTVQKVDTSALEERIARLEREVASSVKTIVVKGEGMEKIQVVLEEKMHPVFEDVMFHIGCGDAVMLVGPRGCGKSFLCEQVARALKRPYNFASLSGGVTESKLFGRVMPNLQTGEQVYHSTPFVDLFAGGGVFLLDEVDAADPNVLLSLNGALANKQVSVDGMKEMIRMNKKFCCVAAANTWGSGADRQYVGRAQQDAAFIERFVQIEMDYDAELERALYPNEELLTLMHQYRERVRLNKLQRTVSTRFIERAFNWMRHGKDIGFVQDRLFAGWRADEVTKVKG